MVALVTSKGPGNEQISAAGSSLQIRPFCVQGVRSAGTRAFPRMRAIVSTSWL